MTDGTLATFTYDSAPVSADLWQEWLTAGAEVLRITFVVSVGDLLDETPDIDVLNDRVDDMTDGLYLTDLSYGVDREATATLWATYPAYAGDALHDTQLVMWVEAVIQWDSIIDNYDLKGDVK